MLQTVQAMLQILLRPPAFHHFQTNDRDFTDSGGEILVSHVGILILVV